MFPHPHNTATNHIRVLSNSNMGRHVAATWAASILTPSSARATVTFLRPYFLLQFSNDTLRALNIGRFVPPEYVYHGIKNCECGWLAMQPLAKRSEDTACCNPVENTYLQAKQSAICCWMSKRVSGEKEETYLVRHPCALYFEVATSDSVWCELWVGLDHFHNIGLPSGPCSYNNIWHNDYCDCLEPSQHHSCKLKFNKQDSM